MIFQFTKCPAFHTLLFRRCLAAHSANCYKKPKQLCQHYTAPSPTIINSTYVTPYMIHLYLYYLYSIFTYIIHLFYSALQVCLLFCGSGIGLTSWLGQSLSEIWSNIAKSNSIKPNKAWSYLILIFAVKRSGRSIA